jgi:RecA-superfamily ATPases implicated in signal transduction
LGGILKGNLILVEGAAGTGKTLLGVEFIYRGITEHDEPGIIVVFETSPKKLIRDAMGFGWNLDELQQREQAENHLHESEGARPGAAFAGQPAPGNRGRDRRAAHLH